MSTSIFWKDGRFQLLPCHPWDRWNVVCLSEVHANKPTSSPTQRRLERLPTCNKTIADGSSSAVHWISRREQGKSMDTSSRRILTMCNTFSTNSFVSGASCLLQCLQASSVQTTSPRSLAAFVDVQQTLHLYPSSAIHWISW